MDLVSDSAACLWVVFLIEIVAKIDVAEIVCRGPCEILKEELDLWSSDSGEGCVCFVASQPFASFFGDGCGESYDEEQRSSCQRRVVVFPVEFEPTRTLHVVHVGIAVAGQQNSPQTM
jgi:hypothetical protein